MRKRIQRRVLVASSDNTKAKKVNLSHLKAFKVPVKRSIDIAKIRYEKMLRKEIVLMFKDLSYNSMLDEKRDLRFSNLTKRNTTDTAIELEKTITYPTSQVWMKDPVLGIVKTGCNFIQETVKKLEVVPAIQWVK